MLLKNTCVCLITINAPGTSVFQFTKGKDDNRETKIVEIAQGAELKAPKGFTLDQAEEMRQISGKSFDFKPAGAAVEIPDEIVAIPAVAQQIKQYTRSRELEEVESLSDYSAMGREDLEAAAAAYGVNVEKGMTDAQLIDAVEAVENA